MAWVTPQKAVGAMLASVPMLAGLLVWLAVGGWLEYYRMSQWPERRRAAAGIDMSGALIVGMIVTGMCVTLHVGHWLLNRSLSGRPDFMYLGGTAWRVLFAAAYAVGFAVGALIFFTAPV